ncbi:unnamed protein product [Effrenium voratum]|uniref:Uncharacterized protein n=1 Tax=Effrenium voratum TaxID=2562239 RepID=A0AA36IUT4_9DINO|nr:unnamed protein product [Effrenium voratum]
MAKTLIPTFNGGNISRNELFKVWLEKGRDFSQVEVEMKRRCVQSKSHGEKEVCWSRRQLEMDGRYDKNEVDTLIANATRTGRFMDDPNFPGNEKLRQYFLVLETSREKRNTFEEEQNLRSTTRTSADEALALLTSGVFTEDAALELEEICVSTAQRYAAAAYDDGLTEDTLRALASLACWGKHQQNVERDFHRWMPYAHGSRLTTHSTVIEVYDPDTASVQQKEIPILLASDVLHSLWSRQSDKLWDVCVGVTSEKTSAFWTAAQHDWASAHPVVKPSGFDSFCKVKWFTDGAQFNTNHELLIWMWSSTLSSKNWSTKFPFAAIPMRYLPSKMLRTKANRAVVQAISWDCKSLLEGRFPHTDQFGNALTGDRALKAGDLICGGWRAAFESWTGDWKERSLSHEFVKRNYQSMRICDQCEAIKPFAKTPAALLPLVFSNFSLDAPWTKTIRNHATYLQETPPSNLTPWLEVPGFDIARVRWDSAHTILLGAGKDLAAAFLVDLALRQH